MYQRVAMVHGYAMYQWIARVVVRCINGLLRSMAM